MHWSETVHGVGIGGIAVTFSEGMYDPIGDGAPGDVTDPASWTLIVAGDDAALSTEACGALAGDDLPVPLAAVGYDAASRSASLSFAGGVPLGDGLHRLFACGTGPSALRDVAGNALDGDGDSIPGGDFVRTFRADSANLLANGHFDCDLDGWTPVADLAQEIFHSSDDADESPDSGSAALEDLVPGMALSIGQCLPAAPSTATYAFSARVRLSTAGEVLVSRTCSFFASPGCTGAEITTIARHTLLADTSGGWSLLDGVLAAPPAAASLLCSVDVAKSGEPVAARLDQVRLEGANFFADGFESGDTSAWSSTTP